MVPLANTSAPLGAVYLTAWTVPSMPAGGTFARWRPSSWSQLGSSLVVWVLLTRLTPAGWRLRYWD